MSFKVLKTAPFMATMMLCAAAAMPSFGAKPYDAEVEYLEAPVGTGGVPYIDTGLFPGDDMGVYMRVMPLRPTDDTTVCGVQCWHPGTAESGSTQNFFKWYVGFIRRYDGYLSWDNDNPPTTPTRLRFTYSANTLYDIHFNHLNDRDRRIEEVNGSYSFSLPITKTWPDTAATNTIYLFAFNNNGSSVGNTGNARIYSAQFTKGNNVVMNLVPVIKDGVGYMYDTIGETLLGKVEGSSSAEFTCGRSIIDESVTLDADADWTHLGQLLISSGVTIDLNGHTLRIVGADGEGTITDNSAGDPGLLRVTAPSSVVTPVAVTTSGNMTIFRSRKPYDAEVEYLEAPLNGSSKVPYIDTGLKPSDDMGVRLRVAPLRESADTTVCGAMATVTVNNKNVDWRWYMGFIKKKDGYLSWGTDNPGTRFSYSPNTIYDILFNHFNSRNRRIEKVGGGYTFDLPITDAWPSGANQNIYLFAYNSKGTAGNTGNARIYSAQFTKGNNVVMDLIPVRKDGVGYMYDKVSETLLAKVPTAPLAFTYVNDAADVAYIEGSVTLDANADWTSRGIMRIDDCATIDLNGHSLTIAGAYGAGTITNSSATLGEVHFVVPTQMVQTCSLALLGNIKVFKEGDGTLSLLRAGQTFTGGVVVDGGTAKAGASCPENGGYWGAEGGTITVNSGATFEFNGNSYFYYKDFVLNGGTLANHASGMSSTYGIGNVTLVADSSLNIGSYVLTYFLSPNPATFDLDGHKLTVNAGAGGQFNVAFPVVDGTVEFETGGYLAVPAGATAGSTSFDLEMTGAAFIGDGALSVSNYLASYTQRWNHGSYQVKVYGTFTPAGVDENGLEYFHGCEMQTGSTIDLSAKTATWDTTATGWNGTGDADGARTVTFADNATVTLDLHGRTLAKGEKIVSWIETPANLDTLTFVLDAATTEAGEELVVTDSGIYYAADESTVAHAYWTGAIDNDVTKPGNWACTNFMGNAVTGEHGVPGASAAVHVSGEVGFQIPASQPIAYDSIVFSNVILTNDCDWSGLAEWAMAANSGDTVDLGSVDLNGRTLRLAANATASDGHVFDFITLAVTSSAAGTPGELHIAVPDVDTYLECSGFTLSGNLKLVKDGAGWLAMTRANQTFTGGVLIAEGTGYSRSGDFSEDRSYWGPDGGTIAVGAGGAFDAYGNHGFHRKNFVLAGGTLANTANMPQAVGRYGIGNVTLAADSVLKSTRSILTLFEVPDGVAAKIDLGGHVLTNSMEYGGNVFLHIPAENGTMVCEKLTDGAAGGYLNVVAGKSGGSPTFSLDMVTSALWVDGTLAVGNYVARYTGGYNRGSAAIKVFGTFTPEAVRTGGDAFHGCEMQNGSFIDLSAKTDAWSSVALGWTGTGNTDGNRTTTFADGATVGILLGTRNVKSEEKIIDWSAAAPSNRAGLTFFGQFANGRRTKLKIMDDGLYALRKGFSLIVK